MNCFLMSFEFFRFDTNAQKTWCGHAGSGLEKRCCMYRRGGGRRLDAGDLL